MKKMLVNYGGVLIFYFVLFVGMILIGMRMQVLPNVGSVGVTITSQQ